MSKILVTGGAGFIGSHLADRLKENGHEVRILDDFSGGYWHNIGGHFKVDTVDLRNATDTDRIISKFKPDIIYHLAANAAENKAQFSPVDITSRNYSAFINVLKSFIKNKGKRFVFTSSIAVYGSGQAPFREKSEPHPEDLYGITKLAAEQSLKVMSEVHGFEYVIARPHNVYGPRQNMRDPYRNVMTIWMNSILRGVPFYIYGDGEQTRCFSYIDDVVDAIYRCGFEKDISGMVFNVGSDNQYTLNQLASLMPAEIKPIHLPDRAQEVREATANHSLAQLMLGYKDSVILEEGIARTWSWCKEMGPQDPVYDELELDSPKIPQNWRKP